MIVLTASDPIGAGEFADAGYILQNGVVDRYEYKT